jgi:hypothetical protein
VLTGTPDPPHSQYGYSKLLASLQKIGEWVEIQYIMATVELSGSQIPNHRMASLHAML